MRYYTSEEAILVRSVFIFRSPLLLCAIKKAHFANVLTYRPYIKKKCRTKTKS